MKIRREKTAYKKYIWWLDYQGYTVGFETLNEMRKAFETSLIISQKKEITVKNKERFEAKIFDLATFS